MKKGQMQIVGIVVVLLMGIIGLGIISPTTAVLTSGTQVVNESLGTVTNGTTDTLANTCLIEAPTSVYDWTNATEIDSSNYTMSPGTYPNRVTNTITWAASGFPHNNTVVGINYTYNCQYADNGILRNIAPNIAVMLALALLIVAIGWVALK